MCDHYKELRKIQKNTVKRIRVTCDLTPGDNHY